MKQRAPDLIPEAATDEPASPHNLAGFRQDPVRARHDGFGEARKLLFLTALRRGASVLEACALIGISNRTAYNHRRRDPGFAERWRLARGAHKLPLELVAWQRAVEGVEEQVYRHGKPSHVRTHYSDSLLRLLLAGEQPGKYGRRAALLPDLQWLTRMVGDCISGETAPLEAALVVALDEIAALKSQLQAPAQIVNSMNPHVVRPRAANDGARRGESCPSGPETDSDEAGSGPENPAIHAPAVNFADKGSR
jgi:hypothetical protein